MPLALHITEIFFNQISLGDPWAIGNVGARVLQPLICSSLQGIRPHTRIVNRKHLS